MMKRLQMIVCVKLVWFFLIFLQPVEFKDLDFPTINSWWFGFFLKDVYPKVLTAKDVLGQTISDPPATYRAKGLKWSPKKSIIGLRQTISIHFRPPKNVSKMFGPGSLPSTWGYLFDASVILQDIFPQNEGSWIVGGVIWCHCFWRCFAFKNLYSNWSAQHSAPDRLGLEVWGMLPAGAMLVSGGYENSTFQIPAYCGSHGLGMFRTKRCGVWSVGFIWIHLGWELCHVTWNQELLQYPFITSHPMWLYHISLYLFSSSHTEHLMPSPINGQSPLQWLQVPSAARSFLGTMLTKDPLQRTTAHKALNDSYLSPVLASVSHPPQLVECDV